MSGRYIIAVQSFVITIHILVAHIYIYIVDLEIFEFAGAMANSGKSRKSRLQRHLATQIPAQVEKTTALCYFSILTIQKTDFSDN